MKREFVIFLVLFGLFLTTGCAGNNAGQSPTPTVTPAATPAETPVTANSSETPAVSTGGKTIEVTMQNFAFNPDSITISSGDTVKWTNMDSAGHDVVGTDFSSSNLKKGDSYEHKFTKAGTYNYICSIHPSMKGTVIVK